MTDHANYYAECRQPGQPDGLRMLVRLELPDRIPGFGCISDECPDGGSHELHPISDELAEQLMADRD